MRRISKTLSLILAVIIMLQASVTAYATTKTSSLFNSSTYTHQTKFDGYKITQGIDVSYYNEDIDFAKVKKAGVDFVIIRVGYRGYGTAGTLCADTKFSTYIKDAKAAGLKVGVYFYSQAKNTTEATAEANYVLDKLGSATLDLPVVWDIEFAEGTSGFIGRLYNANLSKTAMTNNALAFCNTIKKAGYDAMVYASKSFLEDHLNHTTIENSGYGVWLAHYTTNTTYSGDYQIWQYSSTGKVNGISGNVDCNFMYTPDPFAVSSISNQTYTGSAIKPTVTVTYKGTKLTLNEDYTVSYKNNTNIGKATVTITGKGDYANITAKTVNFNIVPVKVQNVKLKTRAIKSIAISWTKVSNADGYQVQVYRSTGWVNDGTTTSTSYTVSSLASASNYSFRVRAYKTVNGTKYYGAYSSALVSATTPDKVTGLSTSARSTNYVTLKWTKQAGATRYRVYKYNSSTGKYALYKEVTTNTCKVTGLKANTTYKFKVRAYKDAKEGITLTGAYSAVYTTYTKPTAPTIKSAVSSSKKKITVKWNKVSSVTGYQVMWSTTKNFTSNYKSVNVTKASTVSKVITTAQSKKTYYVRVRAYTTRNGQKIYSPWSKTLSLKTK